MQAPTHLWQVKDEVIQYYLDGHTMTETAQEFKAGEATVYRFLLKNGIPTRSRAEINANGKLWTEENRQKLRELRQAGIIGMRTGKRYKLSHIKKSPNIVGEKNPQWKGGITPLNAKIRTSPEYRVWRQAVFERDNWACVLCSAHTGSGHRVILHADHILPFATYPELRFDVCNGRTLCRSCHMKTETWGPNMNRRKKNDA